MRTIAICFQRPAPYTCNSSIALRSAAARPRCKFIINGKNETVLVADPNADQKGDEDENSEEEIVGNFSSDGNHLYYHDGVINVDRNTFSSEAPRQYLAQPKHTSMITGVLEHFGLSN